MMSMPFAVWCWCRQFVGSGRQTRFSD